MRDDDCVSIGRPVNQWTRLPHKYYNLIEYFIYSNTFITHMNNHHSAKLSTFRPACNIYIVYYNLPGRFCIFKHSYCTYQ